MSDGLAGARVAVAGGSYAGLCAALAFRCVGANVDVFERSADPSRVGGGIVVQPDFADYLEAFGYARPESVAIPTVGRRFLRRDGSVAHTAPDSTFFTAWDTVLDALRRSFGENNIRSGIGIDSLDTSEQGVSVRLSDGSRDHYDLLIGADGIGSAVRRRLLPDIAPEYAGYVGYRGLIPESQLSDNQLALFVDHFVVFDYPRSHILCYLIPGANGQREPGERRLNWVWYVNETADGLPGVLTDARGQLHRASLGPGEMGGTGVEQLRARAQTELPPAIAESVLMTDDPFVQAIFDLAVPRMVHGRAVLIGDAAFLVRPHTAAGASKAAADAVSLAHVLAQGTGRLGSALPAWQDERMAATQRLIQHGKMIAKRGGLGV